MTSLVSESLQQRVHGMALSELATFLRRSAKALTNVQPLALLLGQPEGDLSELDTLGGKGVFKTGSWVSLRWGWSSRDLGCGGSRVTGTGTTSALCSFSDALIRFSRDHISGEATAPHYVPYLLATLNHQSALRYQTPRTEPLSEPIRYGPSPH